MNTKSKAARSPPTDEPDAALAAGAPVVGPGSGGGGWFGGFTACEAPGCGRVPVHGVGVATRGTTNRAGRVRLVLLRGEADSRRPTRCGARTIRAVEVAAAGDEVER